MSRKEHVKKLIANHNRHLQKLKEQQASFGLHTPPHILTEIEDVEVTLAQLQAELKTLIEGDADEELPSVAPAASDVWGDNLPPKVGGDAIVVQVGAGASGVVIGKNITQTTYNSVGEPAPDDRQVIEQKITEVSAALHQTRAQLDAHIAAMAEFQLKLLHGELTKTQENEIPSANTIIQVGDWLLTHTPQLGETLVGLFATPAAAKVVGKAGEMAVTWVKERLGDRQ